MCHRSVNKSFQKMNDFQNISSLIMLCLFDSLEELSGKFVSNLSAVKNISVKKLFWGKHYKQGIGFNLWKVNIIVYAFLKLFLSCVSVTLFYLLLNKYYCLEISNFVSNQMFMTLYHASFSAICVS